MFVRLVLQTLVHIQTALQGRKKEERDIFKKDVQRCTRFKANISTVIETAFYYFFSPRRRFHYLIVLGGLKETTLSSSGSQWTTRPV